MSTVRPERRLLAPVQRFVRSVVACPWCGDPHPRNNGVQWGRAYYACRRCEDAPGVPRGFAVNETNDLGAVLREGCWFGLTVWVVGGGRSALAWNPREAHPWPSIAVNSAWRLFAAAGRSPTLSWSADQLWLKLAARDDAYLDAVGLRAAPGLDMRIPSGFWVAPVRDEVGHWARRLGDGVRVGSCSGLAAMAVADALGAATIKLVGFDLDGVAGDGADAREAHELFFDRFVEIAPMVRAQVDVVGGGRLAEVFS